MQRKTLLFHLLFFSAFLVILLILASRGRGPYLLSLINDSFLLGLALFLIGSFFLLVTWGTFDLLVKAFTVIGRNLSKSEQALYHAEEGDAKERKKERREGNIRMGWFLMTEGLLLILLSFLLIPFL